MAAKKKNTKKTRDGLEILYKRYYKDNPDRLASLEEERIHAEIARKIYNLRHETGLTQKEPAERVGTTPSVISRLEAADYEGHSLDMLGRIAAAMNRKIRVEFDPITCTTLPPTP